MISGFKNTLINSIRQYYKHFKMLKLINKYRDTCYEKTGRFYKKPEICRISSKGYKIHLRPVKLSDKQLIMDSFSLLSDNSLYYRFMTSYKTVPHRLLEKFIIIDYSKQVVILAIIKKWGIVKLAGICQYTVKKNTNIAEVAFVVLDRYQNKGICTEMFSFLIELALNNGVIGFTADVLADNKPMLHIFEKMGFEIQKECHRGVYELTMMFKNSIFQYERNIVHKVH